MPLAQEDITIDPAVIAGVLTRIYQGRYGKSGDKGVDRRLLEATHEVFNLATASGIAEAVNRGVPAPSAQFLELLDRNNAIFSAFRTHKMQKDVASLLLDDKGKIKKFAAFKRDVTPVIGKYNGAWLRTEYATAVQRSRLATKWQQFVDESDVFPNLEWMQSTALHPGEDHRIFWFTVRPVDDPFWSHHRPGDRWNCQCDLRQTDLPPTDIPTIPIGDAANSPAPGLDNNPGTDGVIFNDNHPYFPKNCTTCPFANMGKKLMFLATGGRGDCYECLSANSIVNKQLYEEYKDNPEYKDVAFNSKSGGMKATSRKHAKPRRGEPKYFDNKYSGKELEKIAQKQLFDNGHSCILLPEKLINEDGNAILSSIDAIIDGVYMDIKSVTKIPDNAKSMGYKNIFKGANEQIIDSNTKCDSVLLFFYDDKMFTESWIKTGLERLSFFQTVHIKYVYVLIEGKLTKYDFP